jgi:large subunit ribosomal protein L32e
MKKEMLEQRKRIKSKKPDFLRQDAHKLAKLAKKWRRAKGIQSKIRLAKKGYRKKVQVGYGSPLEVRGLTMDGLVPVVVSNPAELSLLAEGQAAIIPKSVGQRKKVEIAKKAIEAGIKIINIKEVEKYVKAVEESMQKKKSEKEKTAKEKEKKKAEKEKKAAEKKDEKELADKLTDEEKKEKEKKEREKILTKRE